MSGVAWQNLEGLRSLLAGLAEPDGAYLSVAAREEGGRERALRRLELSPDVVERVQETLAELPAAVDCVRLRVYARGSKKQGDLTCRRLSTAEGGFAAGSIPCAQCASAAAEAASWREKVEGTTALLQQEQRDREALSEKLRAREQPTQGHTAAVEAERDEATRRWREEAGRRSALEQELQPLHRQIATLTAEKHALIQRAERSEEDRQKAQGERARAQEEGSHLRAEIQRLQAKIAEMEALEDEAAEYIKRLQVQARDYARLQQMIAEMPG